jgi:hypothetical protein
VDSRGAVGTVCDLSQIFASATAQPYQASEQKSKTDNQEKCSADSVIFRRSHRGLKKSASSQAQQESEGGNHNQDCRRDS